MLKKAQHELVYWPTSAHHAMRNEPWWGLSFIRLCATVVAEALTSAVGIVVEFNFFIKIT
ncbi:MAG: hypothetical protein ACI8WM_003399 [Burkholderiaceae bacterium]|jgi:hypothetical protein